MLARPRLTALGLAALLATGGGLGACGGPEAERPNVVLVTVDTLRPDRLSCYGEAAPETPHIARLAEQGTLFENAITDTPWTTPSMASVMTGTYATLHGFKSTNANRLALDNVTLAETLQEAGYATAAVIGSFPLDSIYQLDQGFEHYDDTFTRPIWIHPDHERFERLESVFLDSPEEQRFFVLSKSLNDSRRDDAEVSDAAIARLGQLGERPFFLWVHYFGPHEKPDWRVPGPERTPRRLAAYGPDVVAADREVGRLLEAIDARGDPNTLLILHADHGESLGEQGYVGHGQLLNEATMRVPLILRWPGRIAAGRRVDTLARNVDIHATVLDAVGLERPERSHGRSLLPKTRTFALFGGGADEGGGGAGDGDVAYMETYYPAHVAFATPVTLPDGRDTKVGTIRRGVRTARWKYVRSEPFELLDASPGSLPEVPEPLRRAVAGEELFRLDEPGPEQRNLIASQPEVAVEMRALLAAHLADERRSFGASPLEVDEETRLRLESLGYGESPDARKPPQAARSEP
jgi:arylsulfatase A-like enzyme